MFTRLGQYTVEKKLADGGMGSVYLGRNSAGAPVVLKVPHAQDRDSMLALADEARAGIRLRHPAIVETLDFFVENGVSVLVVAYIEGKSLFELRRLAGPLPAPAIFELGVAIAGALDAIHGAVDEHGRPLSMIHRDVSPNNILVDTAGCTRLIDLGIVRSSERRQKATMQGMVKGTLRYLAPEILGGGDHSAATDLWALGVTLWEAALGHYALPGDEMNGVRAAMDGSIYEKLRTSPLEPALREVLGALVAPVEARLRNARAAAAVLAREATRLPGGRAVLAQALRAERAAAPPAEVTEITGRVATAEASAPTLLSSRGDVESVFTSTASREGLPTMPTLQLPRVETDTAATLQMPAARVPGDDLGDGGDSTESAPTIQMGAWTPASGPSPAVHLTPAIDAGAPTRMAMPKVDTTLPAPPTSPAHAAAPPTAPKPQVKQGPAQSLFLPIVVVDEDGEEIG